MQEYAEMLKGLDRERHGVNVESAGDKGSRGLNGVWCRRKMPIRSTHKLRKVNEQLKRKATCQYFNEVLSTEHTELFCDRFITFVKSGCDFCD